MADHRRTFPSRRSPNAVAGGAEIAGLVVMAVGFASGREAAVWAGEYHIGVRLIATMARGDDDETSPAALLTKSLSWLSFGLFQSAIGRGLGLLLGASPIVEAAACSGFAGWFAMAINIATARARAMRGCHSPPGPKVLVSKACVTQSHD